MLGFTGWSGSTHGSSLPLPLVSRINGAQCCDAAASPVASNFFVSSQPTTSPPPLVQSVWLSSLANCRWCVPKQVSMKVYLPVLGSYTANWRSDRSVGNSLAEARLEPFLQKAGLFGARMRAVYQTRP